MGERIKKESDYLKECETKLAQDLSQRIREGPELKNELKEGGVQLYNCLKELDEVRKEGSNSWKEFEKFIAQSLSQF